MPSNEYIHWLIRCFVVKRFVYIRQPLPNPDVFIDCRKPDGCRHSGAAGRVALQGEKAAIGPGEELRNCSRRQLGDVNDPG